MSERAARTGHIKLLQWARKDTWDKYEWAYASVKQERLHTLTRYLIPGYAAQEGQLERLRKIPCPWDENKYLNVAKEGLLEILELLREKMYDWDESTCAWAAREGHLEMLQWLRENGCPWDTRTCECAARGGHLHILQWARYTGCFWNSKTCEAAAL